MRKYSVLFLLLFLLFNCSKEKYLPLDKEGNEVVETTIFQPDNSNFYFSVKENTGSSSHLLLGKAVDEYTSRILLQFDSFPDSVIIDSARIVLYSQEILGDSVGFFQAQMYRILSEWDETEVLNWTQPELSFDSSYVLSTADIFPTASDSDSIVFQLDPALVQQWTDTTIVDGNYGVWIDCEGVSSFIKDFYSSESGTGTKRPKIKIVYHQESLPDSSLSTFLYASQDAFIIIANLKLDDQYLYIGKGIAFHSFINFDISNIIDSTATINKADLRLIINRDNSIFDASRVSDLRVMIVTSETHNPETITIDSTLSGFTGSVLEDTVSVDIRWLVQYWSSKNADFPNYGLLLQSYYEGQTLARTAFYAANADSIRAPKIEVTYTMPPTDEDY